MVIIDAPIASFLGINDGTRTRGGDANDRLDDDELLTGMTRGLTPAGLPDSEAAFPDVKLTVADLGDVAGGEVVTPAVVWLRPPRGDAFDMATSSVASSESGEWNLNMNSS